MTSKSATRVIPPTWLLKSTLWIAGLLAAIVLISVHAMAAPFGYVTNLENNTVSVIDAATNTVVATIPVGAGPIGRTST